MKKGLTRGILSAPTKSATNSVPSHPAQNATLLQLSDDERMANDILKWIAQQGINRFGMYSVGVDLMLSGGLRLSELLLADTFFVNELGQVRIEGRKGSADKLVAPLYHRDWWLARVGWVANPFNFVSRWSWYRFFRAQGVYFHEDGKMYCSVTHAPRKLQAHNLANAGIELASIADVMGHRSQKSTEFYMPRNVPRRTSRKGVKGNGKE